MASRGSYFRINPTEDIPAVSNPSITLKEHLEAEEYITLLNTPCFNMGRKRKSQRPSSPSFILLVPQVPIVTATPFAEYILADNSRLVINQMVDASFLKELVSSSK
ncbi:hypothetical protein GO495_31755 [Chitinophaga oryziterrae]|uniref:Uncharacterized protein n=1 Tax=Chitinophaga oryziterrae TaxID=1031224 RepID=A0A6N8JIZ0_9BACT|nr:hypothetical protein [Chitinophaga oryziterrae]MVT45207.1 hypothetical protein [Chitinophaga oryziterrae]